MNQVSIGKFIAECRKRKNLTQEQLAEKLGISDRAVSKWERGLNLPDASLMLELSNILSITVNELLSAEKINEKQYKEKAEKNLIKLRTLEEKNNKTLLNMEIIIGYISTISFLVMLFIASYATLNLFLRLLLIFVAIIILSIGLFFAMKLEREVGYYECKKCNHRYIPKLLPFLFSMHIGRTRYLKCPKCNKRSWNKKVLVK